MPSDGMRSFSGSNNGTASPPAAPGGPGASAAEAAVRLTGATRAWAIAWHDGEERVDTACSAGVPEPAAAPLGLAREALLAGQPLVRPAHGAAGGTYVAVPAARSGPGRSVVVAALAHGQDPGQATGPLHLLADQLGMAGDVAALRSEVERSHDVLLHALGRALDLRDGDTGGHSRRVAALAVDLAQALGFREDSVELRALERGALLHDVGKIGIADAILRKPGPLSDEQWTEMRRHPEYGLRILQGIPWLADAAEMVYASHERWDGQGYPRGLVGDESPLGARIFMLADAWDAMTSDRPYRRALPLEVALEEVRSNSGTQFDPEVAVAFEQLVTGWDDERWLRESAA